jgi:hypothetical protein
LTVKLTCVRVTPGILPTTCRVHLTIVGKLPGHRKASALADRTATIAAAKRASINLTLSRGGAEGAAPPRAQRAAVRGGRPADGQPGGAPAPL